MTAAAAQPAAAPGEVASYREVICARLAAWNRSSAQQEPGLPRWRQGPGNSRLLQLPLRHDLIMHAPTGAILWQFAEVALRGRNCRVSHLTEPTFTTH